MSETHYLTPRQFLENSESDAPLVPGNSCSSETGAPQSRPNPSPTLPWPGTPSDQPCAFLQRSQPPICHCCICDPYGEDE